MRHLVVETLRRLGAPSSEVHVLFTGDREISRLNREYRRIEGPTDVLSFPDGDRLPTGDILLGEVVVSMDSARRQAAELGHDELRELEELLLHGVLHLLGHDHVTDDGEMDRLELELRSELLP